MELEGLGLIIACAVTPVAVLIVVIWGITDAQKKRNEKIRVAATSYQDALSALKHAPSDNDLRENALELGRIYAYLARNEKRTMFDEVALLNDLNAIQSTSNSATSVDLTSESNVVRPATDDIETRLQKLNDLLQKGLITESEYQETRTSILDEI